MNKIKLKYYNNLNNPKFVLSPIGLPGMLVQVEIIGEKRSILEYIMKPILDVSNKALTEK